MTASHMIAVNSAKAIYLNNSAGRNANSQSRSTANLTHEQVAFSQTQYNVYGKATDAL
jgi:hypothetical protein